MIAEQYTAAELITLIAAVSAAVTSILAAWRTGRTGQAVAQVHTEVKTMNGLRMGELADNTETRRILELPKDDRTRAEQTHVEAVGITKPNPDAPPGG